MLISGLRLLVSVSEGDIMLNQTVDRVHHFRYPVVFDPILWRLVLKLGLASLPKNPGLSGRFEFILLLLLIRHSGTLRN